MVLFVPSTCYLILFSVCSLRSSRVSSVTRIPNPTVIYFALRVRVMNHYTKQHMTSSH